MSVAALAIDSTTRTRRAFAGIALAASLLTLVVIVASAYIRHTQAGLSCVDWPACYAAIDGNASAATGVSIARILHRLAATGALVLVVGLWLSARARGPGFRRVRVLALAALLVAIALAVLGIATPGATIPAVPLGNLIGGLVMLALLAALFGAATSRGDRQAASDPAAAARRRRYALALLALVFAQASIGGLIGTGFALTVCTDLFRCAGFSANAVAAGDAFVAFQPLSVVAGHAMPAAGAAALHVIHRLLGVAGAVFALLLAYRLRAIDPRAGGMLAVLALAAPLLGVAAVVAMPALGITVLHNAAAALLVATLSYAAARSWAVDATPLGATSRRSA